MNPLTEKQIRSSFVNCSRREAAQLALPLDLAQTRWDRLDLLGWIDRKAPLRAYVVVPVDDAPVGVALRAPEPGGRRRRAVCAWCEDVYATNDVALYVAARAGAAGRKGDTVGTLVCTTFECSRNVRRLPKIVELGTDPADVVVERRVAGLRARSERFVREVLSEA
ncbi:FBP domain-containing protein [Actinotalea sp. JY-7876]|uniref:FBP domain-containing protein n=1 Tax=Actinotalea sp. JY-7876 TaxID=2758442 RepID=UPI0015F445D8|nr:FBP domain-containing protein [Actinotalea sp. JY-7876]